MIFKRFLQSARNNVAFAFDIDGVLLRGKTPIPGAGDALRLLNQNKVAYILLTNGGGFLEKDRTDFISKVLDVEISPLQIVLSHSPYKALVGKYDRILAVGTEDVRKVAETYGFKDVVHQTDILRYNRAIAPYSGISDEQLLKYSKVIPDIEKKKFDAVLVFNDPHDWAADIQIISDALNSENGMLDTCRRTKSSKPSIPIYFSNQDLLWASDYSLNRIGQGAFRLLNRQLYSALNDGLPLEDFAIGKPTKLTYDFAHHVLIDWRRKLLSNQVNSTAQKLPPLGVAPYTSPFEKVYMVGDNPASDIIGAQRYGWDSCLVKTGVYQDGTPLGSVKPTMIVNNVYEAVKKVLDRL
ncbi:YKR070W [Zygosaccharomyces parabailii]|nr:YKR070W [Zygosaccharomyces parabailii]